MAKDQGNLSKLEFKFFFFPWWKNSEYKIEANFEITSELLKYFTYLEKDQGIKLNQEQRAWYALKKESLKEEMQQEYPSFPEEAFLASGRPVFSLEKISRDIKRAKLKTPIKGIVNANGFSEISNGPVLIFKKPVAGEAYAIGADVAEGLVNGDFSTASVLNKNFEQVATYCGHLAPDQFGALLVNLAKYYNNAVLAPEQNNHGHATLAAIKNANYFKVFKREVQEELGKELQAKVGWLTTAKSKMLMIDELKAAYRDDSLIVNDEATLREMMTLTIEDSGDIIMNSKDRTVALAISIQAIKQAVNEGENKAYIPSKANAKDVTKMSIDEKMKYYARISKND